MLGTKPIVLPQRKHPAGLVNTSSFSSTINCPDLSRGLGEDSPPLVGGEESPSCSFLLCLDVSSDGVLADVSDTAEIGAG